MSSLVNWPIHKDPIIVISPVITSIHTVEFHWIDWTYFDVPTFFNWFKTFHLTICYTYCIIPADHSLDVKQLRCPSYLFVHNWCCVNSMSQEFILYIKFEKSFSPDCITYWLSHNDLCNFLNYLSLVTALIIIAIHLNDNLTNGLTMTLMAQKRKSFIRNNESFFYWHSM